ncbi:MAG: heparinase II/III family protein [Chitinispirillaceae bacterium]|nr:heparinase II/III family protein [Chitinispirillaceae bacterium]
MATISVLLKHYSSLFGTQGIGLLADKVLRKILPVNLYQVLAKTVWMHHRKSVPENSGVRSGVNANGFQKKFPDSTARNCAVAADICRHQFDFLGTGSVSWHEPIAWHTDIKTGHAWPVRFYVSYRPDEITPGNGVDPKVPWELSRCHHFVALAQAWALTKEERFAGEFVREWEHWVQENPWGSGINWASTLEVAIRAVNWLWARDLFRDALCLTKEREQQFLESIRQHAVFIEHNLECGVRNGAMVAGNHYLGNVSGLACIGMLCPGLPGADRWKRAGLKALEKEIRRQVPPDGFFFESSTAYHRFALELFLVPAILARRSGHEMSSEYWAKIEKMMDAVLMITRPDGCVPFFGDNDDGRLLILSNYPSWTRNDFRYLLGLGAVLFKREDFKAVAGRCPEEVFWLLGDDGCAAYEALQVTEPKWESNALADAGLYVIRNRNNSDYALVRAGTAQESAPNAHAHNDTLSLELWISGKPVLVDPGTFCYTSDGNERNQFRSTAAHSTIMVDGKEISSIPQALFGFGRDAKAQVAEWSIDELRTVLQVRHDGFERLAEPVTVQRRVEYDARARTWVITDDLVGKGDHSSSFYWQFAPGEKAEIVQGDSLNNIVLHCAKVSMELISDYTLTARLTEGYFASGYGVCEKAPSVEVLVQWHDAVSLVSRVAG